MVKRSIWDILAWVVLFLITVWLVLKTIGVINTPLWLTYAPLYGAVYLAGNAMHKLDVTVEEVKELRKDYHILDKRVALLEQKISNLDERISTLEGE